MRLPDIMVTGRSDSQVGIADSASQGNVGQEQLKLPPSSVPAKCWKPCPASSCRSTAARERPQPSYLRLNYLRVSLILTCVVSMMVPGPLISITPLSVFVVLALTIRLPRGVILSGTFAV